jgi:hypothetical protein
MSIIALVGDIDTACNISSRRVLCNILFDAALDEVWPVADSFTLAYVECALWSSNDESDESGGEPLDRNYSNDDLAPETWRKVIADCLKFQRDNRELLEQAYTFDDPSPLPKGSYDDEYAGHDFWLTRNGHGAGFWDRGLGSVGDKLTKACKTFKECNPYVGDDGQIYIE